LCLRPKSQLEIALRRPTEKVPKFYVRVCLGRAHLTFIDSAQVITGLQLDEHRKVREVDAAAWELRRL
jgi:hypothetical protein